MKNFTGWAVASIATAMLGGCTTTADTGTDDGGTTSAAATTSGSGGAGGSTTTTTGTGGSGTGGSTSDGGGVCAASAGASACELCAFSKCMTETCACDAITDCKDARGDYFTCLAGLDGGDMESCASNFVTGAGNAGSGKAGDLATCMDACQDACQGKDGG